MLKKTLYIFFAIFFITLFIALGPKSKTKSATCGINCSLKEIGSFDPISGSFIASSSLQANKQYWVRLTINGQDTLSATPKPSVSPSPSPVLQGSDIMLMMDMSSSMDSDIPQFKSSSTPTVIRIDAAKAGLKKFIDLSNQATDYVGLGTQNYCNKYNNPAGLDVYWAYQDWSPYFSTPRWIGFSTIHVPLQALNGKTTYYKSQIDAFNLIAGQSSTTWCHNTGINNTGGFNGGTTVGAMITAADTFLTPILNSPNAKRSKDGTSFRNSSLTTSVGLPGFNNGPRARDMSGINVGKYIVLFSDGGEGSPPLVSDEEIDKAGRNIVQTAAFYNVHIYTVCYAKVGSSGCNFLQNISNQTGGKMFGGNSQEEIINNLTSARNSINTSTSPTPPPGPTSTPGVAQSPVIVNEKINASNFKIDTLKYDSVNSSNTTFKITKPGSPETDLTSTICGGASLTCVSNQLPNTTSPTSFSVTLDPLKTGDVRYVYFRVTTNNNTGSNIKVDDDTSTLNYTALGLTPQINNTTVSIAAGQPYFQVTGGDIYSNSATSPSLTANLPALTTFVTDAIGIVMHTGTANYGTYGGTVSSTGRDVSNYSITNTQTYSKLKTQFKPKSQALSSLSSMTTAGPGVYEVSPLTGGAFVLDSSWNSAVTGQYVIFVPGDLYISSGSNFSVTKDGKSFLSFIVQGNIGIDPSLTKVEGMYLADGVIDTVCQYSSKFVGSACAPDNTGSSSALRLEGMYLANSGYLLDRKGTPGSTPGETFVYRPDMVISGTSALGQILLTWKENTGIE